MPDRRRPRASGSSGKTGKDGATFTIVFEPSSRPARESRLLDGAAAAAFAVAAAAAAQLARGVQAQPGLEPERIAQAAAFALKDMARRTPLSERLHEEILRLPSEPWCTARRLPPTGPEALDRVRTAALRELPRDPSLRGEAARMAFGLALAAGQARREGHFRERRLVEAVDETIAMASKVAALEPAPRRPGPVASVIDIVWPTHSPQQEDLCVPGPESRSPEQALTAIRSMGRRFLLYPRGEHPLALTDSAPDRLWSHLPGPALELARALAALTDRPG